MYVIKFICEVRGYKMSTHKFGLIEFSLKLPDLTSLRSSFQFPKVDLIGYHYTIKPDYRKQKEKSYVINQN